MASERTISGLQLAQARDECWELFGRDIPTWQMLLTMELIVRDYREGSDAHRWLVETQKSLEMHRAFVDLILDHGPYEFAFTVRAADNFPDHALISAAEFLFKALNRKLFGHKASQGAALDGFVTLERQDRWGKPTLPHFHAVLKRTPAVRGEVTGDDLLAAVLGGARPTHWDGSEDVDVFDMPAGLHILGTEQGGMGGILSSYLVKQVSPVDPQKGFPVRAKLYRLESGELGELA